MEFFFCYSFETTIFLVGYISILYIIHTHMDALKNLHANKQVRDFMVLVARFMVGGVFMAHGLAKISEPEMMLQGFTAMGLPAPLLMVYLLGLTELLAGLAIFVGFYARYAAMVIAVIMFGAIFTIHKGEGLTDPGIGRAVGFLASSILLIFSGSGSLALVKTHVCNCDSGEKQAKKSGKKSKKKKKK